MKKDWSMKDKENAKPSANIRARVFLGAMFQRKKEVGETCHVAMEVLSGIERLNELYTDGNGDAGRALTAISNLSELKHITNNQYITT